MWFGVAAYTMWGLFPLYWKLLQHVSSDEILAHRTVWACLFLLFILLVQRHVREALHLWRRHGYQLAVSAALIGVNWFTYIWGVNNGFVIECSLGYFLNPLVSVLFGVIFLGEHLRSLQRVAVVLAAVGVAIRSWELGSVPFISLVLAFTFALYALVRKRAQVPPIAGLAVESAILSPLAVGYLFMLAGQGALQFFTDATTMVLLVLGGVVTALPLLCFGAAAQRVGMITLGMLQYIAPTLQFLLGVFVYEEQVQDFEWVGLACIWCALVVFVADIVARNRTARSDVELQ